MKKSAIQPLPEYFDRYINLVEDIDLCLALEKSLRDLSRLDLAKLLKIGNSVYAPGKWTVKDIIQHITDTERVFCYRSLRFARKDNTQAQSYDENMFAKNAAADERRLEDLLEELKVVRQGTLLLFKSFSNETLLQKGICWKFEMSVLAMGFTLAGHQAHHLRVIEDRYYPLIA